MAADRTDFGRKAAGIKGGIRMKKEVVKKVLSLVLASVMAVGCLAGCGSSGGDSGGGTDKLSEIMDKGKIVIGVNPPGEPICFYDDQGNLIGYDVDFANKLGEVLGVEVELVEVNGENRISSVTSGRVDVIFANITGNLERAKSINSTFPADIFKQSLYKCCLRVHPFSHFTFDTGCNICRQSRKLLCKQSHKALKCTG